MPAGEVSGLERFAVMAAGQGKEQGGWTGLGQREHAGKKLGQKVSGIELLCSQAGIQSTCGHEFGMGAGLHHTACIHHHNPVGFQNC